MGTGHEDPRERRRDELRRIVYGTPGIPPDELVAELAALEEELAPPAASAVRGEPAAGERGRPSVASGADAAGQSFEAADTAVFDVAEFVERRSPQRRRRSPRRVLATSAAVIAAVIILLGPVRDALAPPQGLEVFERSQTDEERRFADQVATDAGLDPYTPEALRSLGRLFGHEFWVYRTDDVVCLLSQRLYFFAWEESCVTLEAFGDSSLTLRIAGDTIRDGSRPRRFQAGDIVVVGWGPASMELEWWLEPDS